VLLLLVYGLCLALYVVSPGALMSPIAFVPKWVLVAAVPLSSLSFLCKTQEVQDVCTWIEKLFDRDRAEEREEAPHKPVWHAKR